MIYIIGKLINREEINFMKDQISNLGKNISTIYLTNLKKETSEINKNLLKNCNSAIVIMETPHDNEIYFYIGMLYGLNKDFKLVSSFSVRELMNKNQIKQE